MRLTSAATMHALPGLRHAHGQQDAAAELSAPPMATAAVVPAAAVSRPAPGRARGRGTRDETRARETETESPQYFSGVMWYVYALLIFECCLKTRFQSFTQARCR